METNYIKLDCASLSIIKIIEEYYLSHNRFIFFLFIYFLFTIKDIYFLCFAKLFNGILSIARQNERFVIRENIMRMHDIVLFYSTKKLVQHDSRFTK